MYIDWWIILIIVMFVILIMTLSILIIAIKKNKQQKLSKITKDINKIYSTLKLQKIITKELPVSVEDIKDDIYYNDKVILGKYEYFKKISGQDISLKTTYNISKSNSKPIFLRYKIRDVNFIKSSDFIPLNQIDLLVSQKDIYFIDPFDPQIIPLAKIKNITFFWEKNKHIKNKQKFIGIEITFKNKHFFLLFNKYNDAINFAVHVMLLS